MVSAQARHSSAARRETILAAARRCFAAQGLGATSIEDVRKRSGASVGSIYHHFRDKSGLAAAVYVDALERYQRRLVDALESANDAEGAVRAVVHEHFAWVGEQPALARFMLEVGESEVRIAARSEVRRLNRRLAVRFSSWASEARASGELAEVSDRVLAALLIGTCKEATAAALHSRASTDFSALASSIATTLWNALRPTTTTPHPNRKEHP